MSILLDSLALTELFCKVDDFCQQEVATKDTIKPCLPLLQPMIRRRNRSRSLCQSEILTLLIAFHQSNYRTFKAFYTGHVCLYWRKEFPGLVSYQRFIEWMPSALAPLLAYLRSLFAKCSGITFVDSTDLPVCDNHRIHQHKVFIGLAKRGKTSTGWFFGFKLHLIIDEKGQLLDISLTAGNVDDRAPIPKFAKNLFGKLVGDKGYLSAKLSERLLTENGVHLLTKLRDKMKSVALTNLWDNLLLRKRAVIESVVDQLKNISQVQHTRHRSVNGFLVNLVSALIAYCHQPKKPSLLSKDSNGEMILNLA
ncbi:MAG: IS982 family transposase [Fibrella sp.]|nr:IS982 family transposase [Armatimonadota bacterium]